MFELMESETVSLDHQGLTVRMAVAFGSSVLEIDVMDTGRGDVQCEIRRVHNASVYEVAGLSKWVRESREVARAMRDGWEEYIDTMGDAYDS